MADGSDTSDATATVEDAYGNPVSGEAVTFTTDGDVSFGSVTDDLDGAYGARKETSGPPASLTLQLDPPSITANGLSRYLKLAPEDAAGMETVVIETPSAGVASEAVASPTPPSSQDHRRGPEEAHDEHRRHRPGRLVQLELQVHGEGGDVRSDPA